MFGKFQEVTYFAFCIHPRNPRYLRENCIPDLSPVDFADEYLI